MACNFISQLSMLRKLSAESVENTNSFNPFKEYLHVERQVEIELRELLRSVNENQGKCLVLLCGSAGDGKSHLISYLKNSDSELLLSDYEPYNDATESTAPTLTSIDTLASKLVDFNDENYLIDNNKKMIVAINLGTLNNFIESEKGAAFTKLKEYVENNGIFSGYSNSCGYKSNSVFQHVSFSDYQVFSLNGDGIDASFLDKLISKVFTKFEENPFYQAYATCEACSKCSRCPVRHNYEFLSDPVHQKVLIRRIVEVVIADKAIVSTREVLNLLYDIIVHPDFDERKISIGTSTVTFLTNYINWTTPMLLNEYEDISTFLNCLRRHDVLKERNAGLDNDATRFHCMENIADVFGSATAGTPYQILSDLTDVSILGGIKPDLKKVIYRFIIRLNDFSDLAGSAKKQERLKEYIQYLYFQNSGNEQKLRKLYETTKKAVLSWDGQFDNDYICIDDSNDQFWILEQLYVKSVIHKNQPKISGNIQRFSPNLKLRFRKESSEQGESVELNIDFALFELISDMREGYRPTVQDKNRHADFVSFIQRLIDFGNKSNRVTIVPKDGGKEFKIVFEENDFGYEFKVV